MREKIPESSGLVNENPYRTPWENIVATDYDFHVWRGPVDAMNSSHTHTDIEVNWIESGSITYFAAGRFQTIHAGEVAVFWAGMPHQLTEFTPGSRMAWIVVPLAWFMQWRLPERFAQQLLEGEFRHSADPALRAQDTLQFPRWAEEMREPTAEKLHIVSLEVEARLWRLALDDSGPEKQPSLRQPPAAAASKSAIGSHGAALSHGANLPHGAIQQVETMARFLSLHYSNDLTIAQIGEAVGLHPHYAMEVWKQSCGVSLWEYLTRLRVSHAQRLLLTTDWKVGRIAAESGFGSLSRFYAAFEKYCGVPPRAWRCGR